MGGQDLERIAPLYMRNKNQWCFYKLIPSDDDAKPRKVPFNPHTGDKASPTNPKHWGSIEQAYKACEVHSGGGVSYMLAENDGLVIIDFDNAITPDGINPEVLFWINEFGSYTEVSQSGKGFHIVLFAYMVGRGRRNQKKGIEVYSKWRQICMNPNVYKNFNGIMHAQNTFNEFMHTFFDDYGKEEETKKEKSAHVIPQKEQDLIDRAVDLFCKSEERKHFWFQVGIEECERDASQSGVDWAIAMGGIRLGFSDDVIAAMITRNREMFNQANKLKRHASYLSDTIANAHKEVISQQEEMERRTQLAANGSNVVSIRFRERNGEYTDAQGNIVSNSAQATPTQVNRPQNGLSDALGPDFKFLTCIDIENRVTRVSWLAREYIPVDSIVWVFGQPGAGKSFCILSLAVAVAQGCDWGCVQTECGGVAYLCGEGLNGMGKRLRGLKRELDIDPHDEMDNLLMSNEPVLLTNQKQVWALIDRLREAFDGVKRAHLKLLVVDTKTTCMDGNENAAEDMTRVVRHLRQIQHAFRCTVLVVDHMNANGDKRMRGSTVQTGAAEVTYEIERDDGAVVDKGKGFKSIMSPIKPPKDFTMPQPLEFSSVSVDVTHRMGEYESTLVMLPSCTRVYVSPQVLLHTLSVTQRKCFDVLVHMCNSKMGETEHRVTVKLWRNECRQDGISGTSAQRECAFLIEKGLVIRTAPSGDVNAPLLNWYVSPIKATTSSEGLAMDYDDGGGDDD